MRGSESRHGHGQGAGWWEGADLRVALARREADTASKEARNLASREMQ